PGEEGALGAVALHRFAGVGLVVRIEVAAFEPQVAHRYLASAVELDEVVKRGIAGDDRPRHAVTKYGAAVSAERHRLGKGIVPGGKVDVLVLRHGRIKGRLDGVGIVPAGGRICPEVHHIESTGRRGLIQWDGDGYHRRRGTQVARSIHG